MKTNIAAFGTKLLLASSLWLNTADAAKAETPKPASAEFERMKSLVGSWAGKTISFDFDATCGINPKKESHMHALSITFDDADTITTSCQAIMDGKEMAEKPTTLKRVKL